MSAPTKSVREILARVPPPPAFALSVIVGVLIGGRVPMGIVPGSAQPIASVAGVALIGLGAALALTCIALFVWRRTTIIPHRSASALVTGGPYALSRNPMYVALTTICVGAALHLNVLWSLLVLPLPLLFVGTVHIPIEERLLRAAFGEEYRRYAARVRRWL